MRFGEMINAAIGEALMDGEREEEAEEEDAAGGRLELFLPMTAFARGVARSALAHARSFARRRSTHFCTRAAHGNVSFPHFRRDGRAATWINALVIWHVRIIISNGVIIKLKEPELNYEE